MGPVSTATVVLLVMGTAPVAQFAQMHHRVLPCIEKRVRPVDNQIRVATVMLAFLENLRTETRCANRTQQCTATDGH